MQNGNCRDPARTGLDCKAAPLKAVLNRGRSLTTPSGAGLAWGRL